MIPVVEKLLDRGYPTHVFGGPCIPGELINPDGPEAAKLLETLVEALRPFAAHVGKSGEQVTLTIGKDKWTATLTTDDFERARTALAAARGEQA